jgi:isoquinoline 1-oxidoreductase
MTRFTNEILDHLGIDLPSEVSRRRFLKIFGGGIVVTVSANDLLALQQAPARRRFGRSLPDDFNAFLKIGEDGRVSCFTGKIEMGQGVVTSLAQMLADEIEVALDSVDMVMGDTDLCPWDMGTFGSMSTRFFGPPLRAAAAEAREVLLELAAEKLEMPREQLSVTEGVVSVTGDAEKRISYAELAKGQKIARRLDRRAVLESVESFTVVGKPVNRTDAIAKVTGEAKYAGDIRREGMLYARLLRPPAHGAELQGVDASGIEVVDGATMVVDGDLVRNGRWPKSKRSGRPRISTSTKIRSSITSSKWRRRARPWRGEGT